MEATSAKRHKTLPALELLGTPSRLFYQTEHSNEPLFIPDVPKRFWKCSAAFQIFLNHFLLECRNVGMYVIKIHEVIKKSFTIRSRNL